MLRSFYLCHRDIVLYAFTRKTDGPIWKHGVEKRFKSAVRNERRISKRANKRIRKKASLGVLKVATELRDAYLARGWNVFWRFNETSPGGVRMSAGGY